jgi:hypothetical protein
MQAELLLYSDLQLTGTDERAVSRVIIAVVTLKDEENHERHRSRTYEYLAQTSEACYG